MNKDLSQMPVQVRPCTTCPFEGDKPIPLTPKRYVEYLSKVVNLENQHLCHSAHNQMLCRGGRNILLRVLCAQGFIVEPTDEAFEAASAEALGNTKFTVSDKYR